MGTPGLRLHCPGQTTTAKTTTTPGHVPRVSRRWSQPEMLPLPAPPAGVRPCQPLDEQLHMLADASGAAGLLADLLQVLVYADRYAGADVLELGMNLFGRGEHGGCVEDAACPGECGIDFDSRNRSGDPTVPRGSLLTTTAAGRR